MASDPVTSKPMLEFIEELAGLDCHEYSKWLGDKPCGKCLTCRARALLADNATAPTCGLCGAVACNHLVEVAAMPGLNEVFKLQRMADAMVRRDADEMTDEEILAAWKAGKLRVTDETAARHPVYPDDWKKADKVGCSNFQFRSGEYCGNCGYHVSEHR